MRGERGMSDVVETTSDEDGGAQGGSARGKRKEEAQGGLEGCKWAIILLFHRGRTPRWR